MWWMFSKDYETADCVIYRYSTESDRLDGIIAHDKTQGKSVVSVPSGKDRKTPWKADLTLSRFDRWIVWERFPEYRMVVVGS